MRVIVFFDLPTLTRENKKEYRKFKKFLDLEGFMMMQESVYSKLALNQTMSNTIKNRVEANKPNDGLVQIIVITEKQYQSMEYIVGDNTNEYIDSDEGVILL